MTREARAYLRQTIREAEEWARTRPSRAKTLRATPEHRDGREEFHKIADELRRKYGAAQPPGTDAP